MDAATRSRFELFANLPTNIASRVVSAEELKAPEDVNKDPRISPLPNTRPTESLLGLARTSSSRLEQPHIDTSVEGDHTYQVMRGACRKLETNMLGYLYQVISEKDSPHKGAQLSSIQRLNMAADQWALLAEYSELVSAKRNEQKA